MECPQKQCDSFIFTRIRIDGRIEENRRVREEAHKPWIYLAAGQFPSPTSSPSWPKGRRAYGAICLPPLRTPNICLA
jgi:hypothetical protein